MGNLTAMEKLHQYIERASKTELLFLIAYIMVNTEIAIEGISCPEFMSRGDCKRVIKHMREAQNDHPEKYETLGAAIQFIRREWLRREEKA